MDVPRESSGAKHSDASAVSHSDTSQAAFPTESKERAKARKKKDKESGNVRVVKKRPKLVETV